MLQQVKKQSVQDCSLLITPLLAIKFLFFLFSCFFKCCLAPARHVKHCWAHVKRNRYSAAEVGAERPSSTSFGELN